MKIIGIYKITSPTEKVYIGASKNILKRWSFDYKYVCNVKSQKKLYRSFKKYGIANHKFEIIEVCKIEELFNKEIYWIKFYNSYKKGLNSTIGGQNPPVQNKPKSLEHRLKIGLSNKGKKHSEETKQKIREKRALQKFTPEQIQKASNSRKGKESKLKGRKRPNISDKLKGRKTAISIKCQLYDKINKTIIIAESIQDLSKKSGISVTSILKMRKGETVRKYNNYEYKQSK
jgi:group I intron endonuclease